jgi:putative flippase GtrA
MESEMKPVIVIPANQPGHELLELLDGLTSDPEQRIIVVNDGSTGMARNIFDLIDTRQGQIQILHHAVNLGKGQALKTGFNHFLLCFSKECSGLVTADADGQHAIHDIVSVSKALDEHPRALCLGSRKLDENVPWRSLIGNKVTVGVFKLATGKKLIDTQTGLRGVPADFLPEMMRSSESGYDFELDMLLRAIKTHREIIEIPIKTIYISQNKGSHFNPMRDSLKIYFVFLRFSLLSLSTAAIDYSIFAVTFSVTKSILYSIVAARIVAGVFQFTFGKYWVFRSSNRLVFEFAKYVLLVITLMMLSYSLITPMVNYLNFSPYLSKLIAEGLIFLLSFAAQNVFVYSSSNLSSDWETQKTDWDLYYNKPIKTSLISRNFTKRKLLRLFKDYVGNKVNSICELGGANSSFFSGLRTQYPDAIYTIIDNNQRGLDLFQKRYSDDKNIILCNEDVLKLEQGVNSIAGTADVVFSIGLIEHFTREGTARAIAAHFIHVKAGGVVLITFPTPTWLYIAARRIAEAARSWRFPDERPLPMQEVTQECAKYGEIIYTTINWPIIFTQGIVVVRAYGT